MSERLPVLLFDWDGVIVDSNDWKWGGAWKEVLANEDALMDIMKEILSEDVEKRLSRNQLVDEMCVRAQRRDVRCQSTKEQYLARFKDAVRVGTVRLGLFQGVREVLSSLDRMGFHMYVISMTAQQDLEYTAQQLDVAQYFVGLYGVPGSKEEHAKVVAGQEPPHMSFVVIGDGTGDRDLAEHIGCPFVGVINSWNKWKNDATLKFSIENFTELPALLPRLYSDNS